jgi:subtilisin family serine protease/uncharacterized membrane protein
MNLARLFKILFISSIMLILNLGALIQTTEADTHDIPEAITVNGIEVEDVSDFFEYTPEPLPSDGINLWLRNSIFDPLQTEPLELINTAPALFYDQPNDYKIIQFDGPVQLEWKEQVEDAGGTLLNYIPDYAFIAKIPSSSYSSIEDIPSVRWLGDYHPFYKLEPRLIDALQLDYPEQLQLLGAKANYTLALLEPSPIIIDEFKSEIARLGAEFQSIDLDFALEEGLAVVELTPEQLETVSRIPEVAWIQSTLELVTHNNKDSFIVDARQEQDGPFKNDGTAMWSYDPATDKFYGWTGSNATIAVVDTGVDGTHPAFDGRKAWFKGYNWAGQWQDVAFHGTHVAGTALGNGKWRTSDPAPGTRGHYAGIAPNASLIGQAYLGSGYSISTVMFDAATHGADISTNSWGFGGGAFYWGVYEGVSAAYDRKVRDAGDGIPVSILFSAGNDGSRGEDTIGPPATAKNIISVGSTDDNDGTKISGFSSRGPVDDGRLKPDLLTPGAQVRSARANSIYSYMPASGTSMACPGAAGGAAVVINYYQQNYEHNPSPALVKAVLLAGAQPMPGYTWPDNNQGWGRMNLPNSLLETQHKKYLFYDQIDKLETSDEVTYVFNVAESSNLKIFLVWTDEDGSPQAAKALVNDIDLKVRSPSGDLYNGNRFYLGESIPGGGADDTNNVEAVALKYPDIGEWQVTISGKNVPEGPQDFALIISGPVWEDMLDIASYNLESVKGDNVFDGEMVGLNCSIKNTGTLNFAGSQYVLTDYRPDGSSRKLLVSTLEETLPGDFFNFTFDWNAAMIGTHKLILSLDPLNAYLETNESNNIAEIIVTVNDFGVELVNTQPQLSVVPGGKTDLRLEVYNKGTVNDTYQLAITELPGGWDAFFNISTITVPTGSYRNITLNLIVPASARSGFIDGFNVMTSSIKAPSYSSKQSLSFKITDVYAFEVLEPVIEHAITGGGSTIFDIPVRNTGNSDLLLNIHTPSKSRGMYTRQADSLSEGWDLLASTQKLIVPYNTTVNFTVEVACPLTGTAGHIESMTLTLEVAANGGGGIINTGATRCILNATVEQYYDFDVKLGTSQLDIQPGKGKRVDITVRNKGNGFDTFRFSTYGPSSWAASFSPEKVTIEPFGTRDVELNLKAPSNEPSGLYDIAVKATSTGDPTDVFSSWLPVTLVQYYEIDFYLENQIVIVPAGGTVIFPMYFENKGSGDDILTLRTNWIEGFIRFPEDQVFISMQEKMTYNAIIHIPDYFTPSDYDVEFAVVSGDGETLVKQDVKIKITPFPKTQVGPPDTTEPPPVTNESGADVQEAAAHGLFQQGLFFDIFIVALIVFIIVMLMIMFMVLIERKIDSKNGLGKKGPPPDADFAMGPVTHDVRMVRTKREIQVIRKQRRKRGDSAPYEAVPEETEVIDEPPIVEGEIVEESQELPDEFELPEDEGLQQEEEAEPPGPLNADTSDDSSYRRSFLSLFVIGLIIISGFGI